jgi:hypothetical protein
MHGQKKRTADDADTFDVAVCTIEAASALLNHMLETRTFHTLGCLVL